MAKFRSRFNRREMEAVQWNGPQDDAAVRGLGVQGAAEIKRFTGCRIQPGDWVVRSNGCLMAYPPSDFAFYCEPHTEESVREVQAEGSAERLQRSADELLASVRTLREQVRAVNDLTAERQEVIDLAKTVATAEPPVLPPNWCTVQPDPVVEYRLLTDQSATALSKQVNTLIAAGWEVGGSPTVSTTLWAQPMVRRAVKPTADSPVVPLMKAADQAGTPLGDRKPEKADEPSAGQWVGILAELGLVSGFAWEASVSHPVVCHVVLASLCSSVVEYRIRGVAKKRYPEVRFEFRT